VLRGWAGPDSLDDYETERRPVAEQRSARSADPDGSRVGAEHDLPVDVGGRIPHVWDRGRSTLDLLSPGLTLFTARGGPTPAFPSSAPVTVRRVTPVTARALGVPPGGALVARSDGVPAAIVPASQVVEAREAGIAA